MAVVKGQLTAIEYSRRWNTITGLLPLFLQVWEKYYFLEIPSFKWSEAPIWNFALTQYRSIMEWEEINLFMHKCLLCQTTFNDYSTMIKIHASFCRAWDNVMWFPSWICSHAKITFNPMHTLKVFFSE